MRKLFIIALAAFLTCGCIDKMDPFLFSIMEMGTIQSPSSMLGDDGNLYQLKDLMSGDEKWVAGTRVLASMKVSKEISDKCYEVSEYQYVYPYTKEPVELDAAEMPDSLGKSGINVSNAWFAGGHLNMLNQIYYVDDQGGHVVNLVVDSKRDPESDTLKVWLKHLAGGTIDDASVRSTYSFYSTFPLSSYLPEKDSVVLSINYYWDGEDRVVNGKIGR